MRWSWAILGVSLLILLVAGLAQYMPQARDRAAIREAVRDYLAKQYYTKPQILGIRIADGYATALVYDYETLVLFLQKRQGKWEVVTHGNLLTRETVRLKAKGVPDRIFDQLEIPRAGTIGGATVE
ncbi:hypothetical protein HRbin17_00844 [bacterium HR17]|jgi:hypothetical protein|uniref:Uncharacterized protein n=1 Tax=Candidatus Fervidibacter japonicus TaxID=2035412 RepID=A0A2H5XAY2_9BACT|nr:hypothetical protein HRbin17_00844 [bacterium HR17]